MSLLSKVRTRVANAVRPVDLSHVQGASDATPAAPDQTIVVTLDHGTRLQQHRLAPGEGLTHLLTVQGRAWHHVHEDDLGGWIYAPVTPARPGDTGTE